MMTLQSKQDSIPNHSLFSLSNHLLVTYFHNDAITPNPIKQQLFPLIMKTKFNAGLPACGNSIIIIGLKSKVTANRSDLDRSGSVPFCELRFDSRPRSIIIRL